MTASANRRSRFGRTSTLASAALIILQLLAMAVADPTGTQCNPPEGRYETCVCQASNGVVDVTGLSNGDGESARFTDLQDNNQFYYSYNPCTSFYSDSCYNQVYSCQHSEDGSQIYSIANDGTEQMWIDDDGTVYLYYTGDEGRETRVNLHCDLTVKDPVISTDGDSAVPLTYVFDLTGCDVCPDGCDGGGGGGGGGEGEKHKGVDIGAAGIIVIAMLVLFTNFALHPLIAGIVTYFVAGALIMKFHFKATGTDIIPNKKLWFALPLLLKDGCVFTFSPCVGLIRKKKDKYDEIPP